MKRVLLDTNVLIDFLREPEAYRDALGEYERIVLTPTVVGEFRAGISDTLLGRANLLALEEFMATPAVEEVPLTSETGACYARIFRALKASGTPIPTNDIWIAAAAIQHACPLFTNDTHFSLVPSLALA